MYVKCQPFVKKSVEVSRYSDFICPVPLHRFFFAIFVGENN